MFLISSGNDAAPTIALTSLFQRLRWRRSLALVVPFVAAALGVSYKEKDIGLYRVFYDLSAKVEPWQLQPYPGQPAPPWGGQP
jgi:hypothetical protein